MPILVTDYSWTQTDSTVCLSVPLKGTKVSHVNILSTDEYLKVHYPPYLFEAFLFEPVDDNKSNVKVGDGVAVFSMPKRTNKVWEHLMTATNHKEKKKVRERSLLKYQENLCAQSILKAKQQHAEKKYALERMMKLEKEKKHCIQKIKTGEREKSTAELTAWKLRQKQRAEQEDQLKVHSQGHSRDGLQSTTEKQENGCSNGSGFKWDQISNSEAKSKSKQKDLPAPRLVGNIQVTFTLRLFPTALRESKVIEEEEWLKRQAEAGRNRTADVEELEDLKEEERNPYWLKDKGDKCFVTGDHLGAVYAYSLAIRLNRKIPALYSNRAACHLKLKNLHKAIDDSSQLSAGHLLVSPVWSPSSRELISGLGLHDYQAALKIEPDNEVLQADTQRIRDIIQRTAARC
ncbi:dynein axonemal assembly factor 4 isoform 2-T2 [Spinachia spinachia]